MQFFRYQGETTDNERKERVEKEAIMSIRADYHLHSHHSGDSDAPMEEMVKNGITAGLESMCFTEHVEYCRVTSS